MSQLFAWSGQSIGVSASASVLPVNTQDWFPSEWTDWISLQSKGLSRVNTTVQKHQFFGAQLSSQSNCRSLQIVQELTFYWGAGEEMGAVLDWGGISDMRKKSSYFGEVFCTYLDQRWSRNLPVRDSTCVHSLYWICYNVASVLAFFSSRILVPGTVIKPMLPALEGRVLTTGTPRKSLLSLFLMK